MSQSRHTMVDGAKFWNQLSETIFSQYSYTPTTDSNHLPVCGINEASEYTGCSQMQLIYCSFDRNNYIIIKVDLRPQKKNT